MKKTRRIQILFLAAFLLTGLFSFLKTEQTKAVEVASPKIIQFVQSGQTSTSITVAWEVQDTAWLEVWVKESLGKQDYRRVAVSTGNAFQIPNLASGTTYDIMLVAVAGVGKDQKKTSKTITGARTSLGETSNVYQISWDLDTGVLKCGWDKMPTADGYETYFETADEKTTLKVETVGRDINTASYIVKNNRSYKFSVRAFSVRFGVKTFSAWKSIIILEQPIVKSAIRKNGKLTIKWAKVKGCDGYDVYASDRDTNGYVKIKSVKGSKNSVTVKKVGKRKVKKKKVWYVYVVAKRGSSTSGRTYYYSTENFGKEHKAFP